MLGAFADGLFSGMRAVMDIREKSYDLKVKKKLQEAADEVGKNEGAGGKAPLPEGKTLGGDKVDTTHHEIPLEPVPSTPQTKSATAADEPNVKSESQKLKEQALPEPPPVAGAYDQAAGYGADFNRQYGPQGQALPASPVVAGAYDQAAGYGADFNRQYGPPAAGPVRFGFGRGLYRGRPGETGLGGQVSNVFNTPVPIPGTALGFSIGGGLMPYQVPQPAPAPLLPGVPPGVKPSQYSPTTGQIVGKQRLSPNNFGGNQNYLRELWSDTSPAGREAASRLWDQWLQNYTGTPSTSAEQDLDPARRGIDY